ncbi:2-dehydro-3-deoxyphosphogluconate aldolase / (4S)-4-hydroxy-2-oxoglutarate aldolase [Marchantia polymorpha subsp. ruderalis]|uniref:KHG/KDPG aldolase n=2 Tax=Marchantia polymorpha TaxID=3197 RepID=A0AAF6BY41_MARPO|nr:hypothetical protein MARPO_0003s0067 [Marchantia polymorpha]PTQ49167.1 hypothetical protein MARPO_0003s0067 [Marchantia polymorpha]BBN16924.1 hypothetical protein Mp_7g10480 [Marchantia polymorpha subsp. ruderalis]BBN16925.1 hypothetical protein Mp_7g10480 [Marchantia polymorpha subsp. ruderalis]|eukprot:PTQ49166.1 hypothetical protein MARPO_0003s0067 [Marchantia polymorpha]
MAMNSILHARGIESPAAAAAAVLSCTDSAMSAAPGLGLFRGAAGDLCRESLRRGGYGSLSTQKASQLVKKGRKLGIISASSSAGSSTESARDQNGGTALFPLSSMQSTLHRLRRAGIIACLRTTSADVALDAARAALDGGLTTVEVTMTTPSAAKIIDCLVREYPSATIGAGTVLSMQEAEVAKQAGAKFLTSPVTMEDMVRAHKDGPVLFIPGTMTPTEVVTAHCLGACAVKLFPVALLGGVQYALALQRTLPHIPLIVSSGISLDMVEPYFSAGVMAVIVSDAVFGKAALETRDYSKIKTLASAAASKCLSRSTET